MNRGLPQLSTNSFSYQPNGAVTETLDAVGRQDKGRTKSARPHLIQPAPLSIGIRPQHLNRNTPRSPEPLNLDETAGQAVSSPNVQEIGEDTPYVRLRNKNVCIAVDSGLFWTTCCLTREEPCGSGGYAGSLISKNIVSKHVPYHMKTF
jgi:hypothetical protein